MPPPLPELLRLLTKRRLEFAKRLWASVETESAAPVPAEHRAVLGQRLAANRSEESKPVSIADLMRCVPAA